MVNKIQGFRLSPQQKFLWLSQQDSFAYRAQYAISIEGNIKIEVLEKALQKVINRHEILRTTFPQPDGMKIPIQVIADNSIPTWQKVNLSNWNTQEQEAKIAELFQQERCCAFDFARGPVLRLSLLKLAAHKHILLITLPSLCADAWTLKNLVREISHFYKTCLQGREEPADDVLQYVQFSEWQNELLENEDGQKTQEYWRKQSISNSPALKLISEGYASQLLNFETEVFSVAIEPEVTAKLKAIVHKYNTSTAVFLLACWQTLLWRLTGETEMTVGHICDCRKYKELHNSMGLFAKTLPISCHFQENLLFREILAELTKTVNDNYARQEDFIRENYQEETRDTVDFASISFEFEERISKQDAGGVSFSVYQQYVCCDRFKIKLSCFKQDNSLFIELSYDTRAFLKDKIKRLAAQFQTLLKSAIAYPEITINRLEIISDFERQQLLVEFNNTNRDYPKDKCIHHLFEQQVERTPDNLAVVFNNQHITYAEINARSNQLAHYLQTLGVEPEVLVGIYIYPSLEMMVGLLGILKAGGVYVPLDPQIPKERLAFILEDTQITVLLTQQQLVESLPKHETKIVCLDTNDQGIAIQSQENPISKVHPENLAYIIYTSGSTGKPKGTMIPHQGLVNYLNWCIQTYAVAEGQGAPVHSSIGFDATITSLFSPLLVGKKVVLLPREQEIEALSTILRSNSDFSLIKITPSHLEALNQLLPNQETTGQTRALIIGGEALLGNSLSFWRIYGPDTRLINEYGPTEAVVGCCFYEVSAQTKLDKPIPIGRPIANTQIYILDNDLQPVPIGVPGEMYIGGDGLARGYLNRPELTAEKFIHKPFSYQPGTRLYKTGDRARYLADGNIEFLGRLDDQVKIRGFRIELAEIEAVLVQHPEVREAVVIVREDQLNKRLVAYVVAKQERPKTDELRHFLSRFLPEYMIPSSFMVIDALPLTSNGKVDRRALSIQIELPEDSLRANFVPPRTPKEKALAAVWTQVLGWETVGIHDNFFELGGDSIMGMRVVALAKRAGWQILPKQLFQYQTIAELVTVATATLSPQAEQGAAIGVLPLTPIQHWFFSQQQPELHHYNQSVLLEVSPDVSVQFLEQAVQHLLVHHDALRLRFTLSDSGWQQFNAPPDQKLSFVVIHLSEVVLSEQLTTLESTAAQLQTTLNLSSGPLVQAALFHLGRDRPSRLLLIVHHLAVDGVSWRILLEDLTTAYQQLSRGEAIQLPPKTTCFKDWAHRLADYGQSEALIAELDDWLAQSRLGVMKLPVDYPVKNETNTVDSSALVSVCLSPEKTQVLLQEVPLVYNTQINDVLLTALVQCFEEWTGESALLVDLEGHGREELFEDVDLSRTVGWFTTLFPVLLDLGETDQPGEALKLVKEQLRRLRKRGIGYGLLRYLCQDTAVRDQMQALPQAEVSFNYLGQFDRLLSESALVLGLAQESKGSDFSPQRKRTYLLEVNGLVISGKLQMEWIYSENVHQQATIQRLSQGFIDKLEALIVHCQSPDAGGYTPSDFPLAKLDEETFRKVSSLLSQQSTVNTQQSSVNHEKR